MLESQGQSQGQDQELPSLPRSRSKLSKVKASH